jgi:hypothetical protein
MEKLKYISQLNDEQILDLIKIFTKDDYRELLYLDRYEEEIEVTIRIELDDDENEEGYISLEESYTLYDYDVRIWDYLCTNKRELIKKYRKMLLDMFGNQYALDYLLE